MAGEFESENKGILVLLSMSKPVISPVVLVTDGDLHDRHHEALAYILSCNLELMLSMVASDTCCLVRHMSLPNPLPGKATDLLLCT